jgi:futalosine hydrolase
MSRRILIVTAVQSEAKAIGKPTGTFVVVGGIGKTNAAITTTTSILTDGPFEWIINAGVAGALPDSNLKIGDAVIANKCVYAEEGLITPDGFQTMDEIGFDLGNFKQNEVPVDPWMLNRLRAIGTVGGIATVATCSGTDEHSQLNQKRTGCICEAMEGAAVVHTANRLGAKAIELRVISNTTGDRDSQQWNIELALKNLGVAVQGAITALWAK